MLILILSDLIMLFQSSIIKSLWVNFQFELAIRWAYVSLGFCFNVTDLNFALLRLREQFPFKFFFSFRILLHYHFYSFLGVAINHACCDVPLVFWCWFLSSFPLWFPRLTECCPSSLSDSTFAALKFPGDFSWFLAVVEYGSNTCHLIEYWFSRSAVWKIHFSFDHAFN